MSNDDGYDRSKIIGGFLGAPIKNSMLGRNLKSRGALSNNLPFRLAGGLAPYNPYGFLFPLGTEAGAVWQFTNSGGQFQDLGSGAVASTSRVSAAGQALGIQLDTRFPPVQHSLDLNARSRVFGGGGANTFLIGSNTITVVNAAPGDNVAFSLGLEFPVAQWGRCECIALFDTGGGPAIAGAFAFAIGSSGPVLSIAATPTAYNIATNGSVNGNLLFQAAVAIPYCKITILSITGYPGNHLFQATAPSRPITEVSAISGWNQSVYSGRFDGVDDGMSTPNFAAGVLTANMDAFFAVKSRDITALNVTFGGPTVSGGGAGYFGYFRSSDIGSSNGGSGVPTVFVNGVQLAANTAQNLANAIGANTWAVVEYRGLDLSAWTSVPVSSYPSQLLAGSLGDAIICPAQSTANRSLARQLVGASVGLQLS